MTEVEALGCGLISWEPPPGNEGLALNYIVRFFDGASLIPVLEAIEVHNGTLMILEDIGPELKTCQLMGELFMLM